jgi:Raf kinase inhibitor-like YbhB/YbcL family protein
VSRALATVLAAGVLAAGCGGGGEKPSKPLPRAPARLALTSPALRPGATMPTRFTCDGVDRSPPLRFGGVSRSARELVLVMEDLDAPGGTFVHWTVLKLSPRLTGVAEGRVPAGAVETDNSFGKHGYRGPCPPKGDPPHRYVLTLYALSRPSGLDESAGPDQVREALRGRAQAGGRVVVTYGR